MILIRARVLRIARGDAMKLTCQLDQQQGTLSLAGDLPDYDDFSDFGERLTQALEIRVVERQSGADRHQWSLDFEGSRLRLHFEGYSSAVWFELEDRSETELLSYLGRRIEGGLSL